MAAHGCETSDYYWRNVTESHTEIPNSWYEMAKRIRVVGTTVVDSISKGLGPRDKESWWQNESVEAKLVHIRDCFKSLQLYNAENCWRFHTAKKDTKKAFQEFGHNLEAKNNEWEDTQNCQE